MGLISGNHLIKPIRALIWTKTSEFPFVKFNKIKGNVLIYFFVCFLQPVGALNPKRAAFYAERYENWENEQTPPYHYSCHYSTAASALHWLVRIVSKITPSSTLARFVHAAWNPWISQAAEFERSFSFLHLHQLIVTCQTWWCCYSELSGSRPTSQFDWAQVRPKTHFTGQ